MPFRDARTRLEHIEDAILWLDRVVAGRSLADYRRDRALRDIVERNLEKISEASRHLPAALKEQHPLIPWNAVAGIGNRLRHGYDAIDDAVMWEVVTLELPALRTVVEAMLRSLDEGDGADA